MPLTLITGPANAGKAEVVLAAVRRLQAHGHEPLLVVPSRLDVEHYLRELAGGGVLMGARVERFDGLIAEIVRRSGARDAPLGAIARERVLSALAARGGAPTPPGLVRALGELFAELQVRRVTPGRLLHALSAWREADGAAVSHPELGALYSAYHATLQRIGRVDAEQRAGSALDAVRERPALWGRTPVLFYGFDDLTRQQLDAIETLARVDAEVTVSLTYEAGRAAFAGRAATFHALVPLAEQHRELGARAEHYATSARPALSHLERSLFEPAAARVEPGIAVRLLEGGGERSELELVAAEVADLLRGGMPAADIAVLLRPSGTSLELVEEVFASSRIPHALQRRRLFADAAVGRALLGLLRCVPRADGDGELGDLLAWMRAPGLLERAARADSLEARARRAGALSAQSARALWEERHWRLQPLDRLEAAQRRGGTALLQRAERELEWLFSAPRRARASVLSGEDLDEAAALAAGRRALAELRELARAAPELAPAGAEDLARSLAQVTYLSGEAPGPGAVAILDPLALRARRVRALFVTGLQEGSFPGRVRPQPYLAEEERRRLAEVAGLRLGEQEDALAAERYLLYAVLSRPQELLFLSWHAANDDGEAGSRSLFVDDVCDLFTPRLLEERARRPLGAVERTGSPACAAPDAAPGAEPLRHELLLERQRERVWSASSLERWIGCPVRWFVESMLTPQPFEPSPEPLVRGGLAHAALHDTLEELRRQTGSARLTPSSLPHARELLARALAANEAAHPLSVAPERLIAARRRLQADLERYLRHAADTASPLEPSELELGFGFTEEDEHGGGSTLPALDLGGGLKLRGRIDRVDVADSGEAVVYDYKGARALASARWLKEGSVQVALYMIAVERLLGRSVSGGFYQPLAGQDLRARGVLDGDSGVQLECVKPDVRDNAAVRELLAEAVAAARQVAAQAGAGELEPRPHTCAFRGGCEYPTICRCER